MGLILFFSQHLWGGQNIENWETSIPSNPIFLVYKYDRYSIRQRNLFLATEKWLETGCSLHASCWKTSMIRLSLSNWNSESKRTPYFCSMEINYHGEAMDSKNDEVAPLWSENVCHKEGLIWICVALQVQSKTSGQTGMGGRQQSIMMKNVYTLTQRMIRSLIKLPCSAENANP